MHAKLKGRGGEETTTDELASEGQNKCTTAVISESGSCKQRQPRRAVCYLHVEDGRVAR